ncbi:uncharacterized protein BP5553_05844 [Venustampulla echinocandica]|uniref:Rhodopsin domain-containing protein n=1 Tax=Venustampulla echinocandica TaxID=2656787 RepID=A0A370TLU0_9HELO|nr:uncharacterized protein BP5553_05844 [Venustampulla echinocandica]RDL36492.1 hypothetical protein BP5553_05844 [Venustampulla echinocandica]
MYLARQASPPDFGPPPSNESHGQMILGITGFFTAFACMAVLLRMYVRVVMLKRMGADDYVMIVAMLCSFTVFVFFVVEVNLGVGQHFGNPHFMSNFTEIVHWSYHHGWILVVGISSVKISVGIFLIRLVQKKWYKRCIIAWIVFLVIFTVACVGTLIFQCIPIRAAWDFMLRLDPNTKCYSIDVFRSIGLFNGAINIFTDFVFATLPIPVILPLKIDMRSKISLVCILSLGYFACAAAIVKEQLLSNFFENIDNYFNNAFNIWNDVELNVAILAACLPALRPLVASFLDTTTSVRNSDLRTRIRNKNFQSRHRNFHYIMQKDEKDLSGHNKEIELSTMPSRSTMTASPIFVDTGVKGTEDGPILYEERERVLYRHDSGTTLVGSSPTDKLDKIMEAEDSDSGYREGGVERAYLRSETGRIFRRERSPPRRARDINSGGILKTMEVSVTR